MKYNILILFLSSFTVLYSQNTDSLRNIIKFENSQQYTKACITLSETYTYTKPDSSEYWLNKALIKTKNDKDFKSQAQIQIRLGILNNDRGNIRNAKHFFNQALEIAETLKDTSLIISSKGNLGNSYLNLGEYDKAIKIYTEIIELTEINNNTRVSAIAYGALGNLYLIKNEYKKALKYYNISKKKFISLNNSEGIAISFMNIATVYTNMGKYKNAIQKYTQANNFFLKSNNLLNSAKCLSGIAKINSKLKNYKKSVKYETQALKTYKKLNAKMDISYAYNMIAQNYMNMKKFHTAILFLDSALNANIREKNYVKLELVTDKIINCYDSIGNFKKAYEYSKLHRLYYDSIFNIESKNKFSELEIKFETTKKEQELELYKKNQELLKRESKNRLILLISISSFLFFFLVILALMYNRKKLKSEIKETELENRLLRVQMNPHFIFNALSSVENFMYKNDLKSSSIYIAEFAKLMRLILECSGKELISLKKEIEILTYYVKFQKLHVNYPPEFFVSFSENIDIENCLIPPMLIQPFIENSFKYAFTEEIQGAVINLSFSLKNNFIFVEIKDNGIGINSAVHSDKNHTSLAIRITEERIRRITEKKYRKEVILNIQDLKSIDSKLHGTKINFKIPYIEEF
ncbi:MAG: tetratricopeptide repeat protein [Bacteroidales bacterium]|nr:tetratricopeptide repeat protein [Bacteroidales bacterium]